MSRKYLLATFKKYHVVLLFLFATILLTGCGTNVEPIEAESAGLFEHYFIYPFSLLIKMVANWFQGHYGLAIIVITIAIRLILLPFFVKQAVNGQESQHKMKIIKPEMEKIQAKYKEKKNQEDQLHLQKELNDLYQKHHFNPLKMVAGCLPLLLQMPFLIGFYYAIRRTPEIANQSFLWFHLGETDILFVFIAVGIYFIQAKVNMIGLEETQRQQMKIIGYISPIMIGIISFSLPAALPLYWIVSALFMIGQTIIVKKVILPRKQNELAL